MPALVIRLRDQYARRCWWHGVHAFTCGTSAPSTGIHAVIDEAFRLADHPYSLVILNFPLVILTEAKDLGPAPLINPAVPAHVRSIRLRVVAVSQCELRETGPYG